MISGTKAALFLLLLGASSAEKVELTLAYESL
jgi:hypothetical protein